MLDGGLNFVSPIVTKIAAETDVSRSFICLRGHYITNLLPSLLVFSESVS